MNRRKLFAAPLLLLPRTAAAATPWSVEFLQGGFDGTAYRVGVVLNLEPGWKTYWRVPGAGGVPPEIAVTGANVKSSSFDCPLPERIAGAEGTNFGYHNAVCFPARIEPRDAHEPVTARIDMFAGVCETICIPVRTTISQLLARQGSDVAALNTWQMKVPQSADVIAEAAFDAAGPALLIRTDAEVRDAFVECGGLPGLLNGQPVGRGGLYRVPLSGLRPGQSPAGQSCRLTLATAFGGLEQTLVVR